MSVACFVYDGFIALESICDILSSILGRPLQVTVRLCYGTVVLSVSLSDCNVGVLWRNGWMDQDATW